MADQLRLAVAGYLARFKSTTRTHTESHLRCYLSWCTERPGPLAGGGAEELLAVGRAGRAP